MSIIVEFLINGVVLIKLSICVLGRTSVTALSQRELGLMKGFNGYQETFYHKMETICMKLTHKLVHFLVICKVWTVI